MSKLKAVLFDLDGTIINTEPIHAQAFFETFRHFKIGPDEKKFADDFLGASDYDVWKAVVLDKQATINFIDFRNIKNKFFSAILNESTMVSLNGLLTKGVTDFIFKLANQKMKLGLVTASDLFQTSIVLKKIGFEHCFATICTATDTFFSKPNPSPYFYTMRQLHVKTEDIIIFEDSYFGLSAAMQTGAEVIGLATNAKVKENIKFKKLQFINDFKDDLCLNFG